MSQLRKEQLEKRANRRAMLNDSMKLVMGLYILTALITSPFAPLLTPDFVKNIYQPEIYGFDYLGSNIGNC